MRNGQTTQSSGRRKKSKPESRKQKVAPSSQMEENPDTTGEENRILRDNSYKNSPTSNGGAVDGGFRTKPLEDSHALVQIFYQTHLPDHTVL